MQSHPPTRSLPVPARSLPGQAPSLPGPAPSSPGATSSSPDRTPSSQGPTPSRPAIQARGLVKTYPAPGKNPRIRALDGLDLTVAPGTIYAVVGPNGAGKSTTVKILTTLAIADEGSATVE